MFSYSQYEGGRASHQVSVGSVPPKTAPEGLNPRNASIDATRERREFKKAEPGSFAEKEALLLLDKISVIKHLENGPKQPV